MEFQNIPFKIVFLLLIQSFWIVSFYMVLQYIVIRMIKKERLHDWLAFYVPLIRNITWILFFVKVVYTLGKYQPLLILFLTTLTFALVWSIVKDFIQGTVFRFQKGNITGQEIQLNQYKGRVITMGETKLNLELKNGEVVQLPYKKLFTDVLIKPITNKQIKTETLILAISNKSSLDAIEKRLKNKVLAYPWVVFKNGVNVEYFTDEEETERKIKLSYSISSSSKSVLIQEELAAFIRTI